MLLIKQGETMRLGEARNELDEDWEVHWFGTTSSRSHPRARGKFYPGWENPQTGEIIYSNTIHGAGTPAIGQVRVDDVVAAFDSLTIKAGIPPQILIKAADSKLS